MATKADLKKLFPDWSDEKIDIYLQSKPSVDPSPTPAPAAGSQTPILQESLNKAFHFADGGPVLDPDKVKNFVKGFRNVQNYADGGEVISDDEKRHNDLMDSLDEVSKIPGGQEVGFTRSSLVDPSILESQYGPEEEKALAAAPIENNKEIKQFANADEVRQPSSDKMEPSSDDSSVSRLMASLKPNAISDLKKAQNQRDQAISGQQMSKGAALAGAGIAMVDPKSVLGVIEDQDKYVNLPVQKLDEVNANQKFDPKSSMSDAYRQLYSKVTGQVAPENWSAADLEKVSPLFEKYMQAKEASQAKKEVAQQNLEYKKERAAELDELRKQGLISQDEFRKGLLALKGQTVAQGDARLGLSGEKSIQSDDTIKKANSRINSADAALTQLNDSTQPLTNARLNAIQIDLANTLNFMSSQGASDYKAKSDKLQNLNTRLADLKQKYGSSLVDLRKEAPEVYKEVKAYAESVKDSVTKIRDAQDKKLRKQYGNALGANSGASQRIQSGGKQEEAPKANEIKRLDPKTGKVAIFDADSKQFLRYE